MNATQHAAQILRDSKAANERADLILSLIDSKPTADAKDSAMRSVIRDLCFEIESAKKCIQQRDYLIADMRGD